MMFLKMAAERIASAFNDQLLRLMIMEGIAGVPARSWVGSSSGGAVGSIAAGMAKAREALPNLPPEWFSNRDQGLYGRSMAIMRSLPKEKAQEVMDSFMAGLSTLTGEEAGTVETHRIGQMLRRDGEYTFNKAMSLIRAHLSKRAGDLARKIRREQGRETALVTDEGDELPLDSGSQDASSGTPLQMLYRLLVNPDTSKTTYAAIRNALAKGPWKSSPGKVKIFDVMIANPDWNDMRIGEALDMENSYVSRIRREIPRIIPQVLEDLEDSPLFQWQSDRESLSELGFGQQRAFYASNNNAKNLLKLLKDLGVFNQVRMAAALWTAKRITAKDVREEAQRYWSPAQEAYDTYLSGYSTLAAALYNNFLFNLAPKFYHSAWNKGYAERIKKMILESGHKHAENIARNVTSHIFSTHVGSQSPSQYWEVKYSYHLKALQDFAKSGGSPAAPTLESEGLANVAEVVREYLESVEKIRVATETMVKKAVLSGLAEMNLSPELIGTIDD